MRRVAWITLIILALSGFGVTEAAAPDFCVDRLLILSAYPGEIDMLLSQAEVGADDVVTVDEGRTFYLGSLGGNEVALALSGIGLVNAKRTTEIALETFRCGSTGHITGIVFSGVAGGNNIGDVTVPVEWTDDGGTTSFAVDAAMHDVAEELVGQVTLERAVPVGDVACVGVDPRLVTTIEVDATPEIVVEGIGSSGDGFGGRAFPCIPGGGDVFGCRPCRAPGVAAPDLQRFAEGAIPFVDPNFFFEYGDPPPAPGSVAVDMETGAVARVAAANGIPYIAFRGASDGGGDPLMLPGFPFQFFFYRQLAADNAARVTLAFLDAWP
jgi:nucleoside phosphorylase